MPTPHLKIALIGMPSTGKTTVGSVLAQKLGCSFLDLDSMVEQIEGASLIQVMERKGAEYFRDMEYGLIKDLPRDERVVISPAGSIIFQKDAVAWIRENTFCVFLNTPFEVIENRLRSEPKAVAGLKERGLKSIWDERMPLYHELASAVVTTEGKDPETIAEEIVSLLS